MSYSSEVLADAPVHYWKLDDTSGNFADAGSAPEAATANGTPGYQTTPFSAVGGYAVTFSGDDYGQCPTITWTLGNTFTIEALIKTASAATNCTIFNAGTNNPTFRVSGSSGKLQIIKGFVSVIGESTVSVMDDTWHHVAWTKNGSTNVIYVDGQVVTGTITDASIDNNNAALGFGANWSNNVPIAGEYFIGLLDEIAIYSSALTQARIQAHVSAATTAGQVLLPSADSVDGAWTDQAGGTSLAAALDESTASDTDFVRSEQHPSASGCRVKLASGTDPASSTGHVIHWRIRKESATGEQIDGTVKLYQGGGNSQGAGTLIASFDRTNVSGSGWTTYDETLSGGEADSITDYSDLYLEFVASSA